MVRLSSIETKYFRSSNWHMWLVSDITSGGAEPISGSRIITHVSSPLMFLQLNNIGINATNSDFACSTNCHI